MTRAIKLPKVNRSAAAKLRGAKKLPGGVDAARALAQSIAYRDGRTVANVVDAGEALLRLGTVDDLAQLLPALEADRERAAFVAALHGIPSHVEFIRDHLEGGTPGASWRRQTVGYKDGKRLPESAAGSLVETTVGGARAFLGRPTAILAPGRDGALQVMPARYALVDRSGVAPSHDGQDFTPTFDYPPGLQSRDYGRDEAERQKVMLAGTPTRWRAALVFNDDPTATTGPSIIDAGRGWVLGGNSRAMAIERLTSTPEGRAIYEMSLRRALVDHAPVWGLERLAQLPDVERFNVVRLLEGYDPASVSDQLNAGLTQTISGAAGVIACGVRLPDDILAILAEDMGEGHTISEAIDNHSSTILAIMRRAGIITEQTRGEWVAIYKGAYLDRLSREGARRLKECLLGALITDVGTLALATPALENLWRRVAPAVLLTSRSPEAGFDLVEPFRAAAREAVSVVELDPVEAAAHYAPTLWQEITPQVYDCPRAAALTVWMYRYKSAPAAAAKQLGAYRKGVPGGARGQGSLLPHAGGRDPQELFQSTLDVTMPERGEVQRYLSTAAEWSRKRHWSESGGADFARRPLEDPPEEPPPEPLTQEQLRKLVDTRKDRPLLDVYRDYIDASGLKGYWREARKRLRTSIPEEDLRDWYDGSREPGARAERGHLDAALHEAIWGEGEPTRFAEWSPDQQRVPMVSPAAVVDQFRAWVDERKLGGRWSKVKRRLNIDAATSTIKAWYNRQSEPRGRKLEALRAALELDSSRIPLPRPPAPNEPPPAPALATTHEAVTEDGPGPAAPVDLDAHPRPQLIDLESRIGREGRNKFAVTAHKFGPFAPFAIRRGRFDEWSGEWIFHDSHQPAVLEEIERIWGPEPMEDPVSELRSFIRSSGLDRRWQGAVELLGLDVSPATLRNWHSGKSEPRGKQRAALIAALRERRR